MKSVNFQQAAADLRNKIQGSNRYVPITDEEYDRLKCIQFEGVNRRQQEAFKPDYGRMGMREDELTMDWSLIKPNISDGVEAMKVVQPAYAKGFGMVFLWGTWGQGKTLIGKILTATAIRDGKRAAYANMSDVLNDIRLAFDADYQNTELVRRVDWWANRQVLFLDELDKASGTPWAESTMFTLLDRLYSRAIREETLTVIASNRPDDALDGYLKSRLNDRRLGPVVRLNGADARQVMPEGWKF